ncbi:ABC transporter permease/M1 family aminopeptidase [Sphingobacterium sp. Mn56C]|uniref:ABC transporter permease/M1 family aminopeptidase n=1 Tax=Sphingobacterium sp. Mn56C TaxID=3395261 RepID=UPI003BDAF0D9
MFKVIFNVEVKRWLNTPTFYIYCVVFFALSCFTMASALGVFDGVKATSFSPIKMNSAIQINAFLNSLSTYVYFLLPTIIGASVYRDYKYQMHNMLFSYPLTKRSYLAAKFLSALSITIAIVITIILGFIAAQFIPTINQELLGPTKPWAYLQALIILIIPNLILFGAIVFAVVTYARNIYVGFIVIVILFVLQTVIALLTQDMDNRYFAALVDPFGMEPLMYYTKYWTIQEQNNRNLPFEGVILYNRLLWLGVASLILGYVYKTFSFSQAGASLFRKKIGERVVKNNFGSIIRINLPAVKFDFSFLARLKLAWNISNYDFKAIVRNWTFIVVLFITVLMTLLVTSIMGQVYGTETYPLTWKMLDTIGSTYSFFLQILIFLFSGILIQRARIDRMNLLIEATSVPNWVMWFSKFLALLKMVCFVLFISMLSAIGYQIYKGYYHFEIGLYIQNLFGFGLLRYVVLILFALFIQSLFTNNVAGFMLCLFILIGMPLLGEIGVEQKIFKFNAGPSLDYSDMNGFGAFRDFVIYKIYWILFTLVLSVLALLLWRRGIVSSVKERLLLAKKRFTPVLYIPLFLFLAAFISLGAVIYYHDNVLNTYVSAQQQEQQRVDYELKYKRYQDMGQPRIVATKVDLDLYPTARSYQALVAYTLKNKTHSPIDTILVQTSEVLQHIKFGKEAKLVVKDTVLHVSIYALAQPLAPGDSLAMLSSLKSKSNTFLVDRSGVLENGTFFNNSIFPSLGYDDRGELDNNMIRAKYNLPAKERMKDPRDSSALMDNYISNDADWIRFETTISTDEDQIAIAPGYLIKEWSEKGRRYFHYKMDQKMLNFYSFISARFAVKKEKWEGLNLEIYYHKDHDYNLDRMMTAIKKSFAYYGKEFSPYQFSQIRIIEFPKVYGSFAQAFANTVPFSETIGFVAQVNDEDPNSVDYPFSVTSHELAHQWWAHQVIGANVKGATMLSESLAEYSSLKVLEKTYGKGQMRKFLKEALDNYLTGRKMEAFKENPLMYNENQTYIHYNKGSLVMYAMSDLMGEKEFNNFLKGYIQQVGFQEPPYTTAIAFVDLLKQQVPDSLRYAVQDMYETITLYDNAVKTVSSKKINDSKYQVDIEFNVAKYRADEKGMKSYTDGAVDPLRYTSKTDTLQSLPLADYIEIGIFGEPEKVKGKYTVDKVLFLKKYKVDKIHNKVSIYVDKKPFEVGVDPYNKLIDTNSEDNRKRI